MSRSRKEEFERIRSLVNQWNDDHYDIFELSQPNENLEFHGVVRFFFQGAAGANVITKCIRVSSTASTREVIDVLIEKFRPDMRMLDSKYCLLEVHANGEERRLREDEKPLFVQLNWGNDVREGRFLLRNEDDPTVRDPALGFDKSFLEKADQPGFKRKLSKREKKEKKKREREKGKENTNGDDSVANKLYTEVPETSFTRSISNPEAVMRRRRQQKLEKKLAQMNTTEGGNDSGGTLKIFGASLCPDVPYKTLFLSTADPAMAVVKEAMEKYGLDREDSSSYCLVEVLLPPGGKEYHGGQVGDERVLDDNECPLAIVMQHTKYQGQGHIIFQLRQRAADYKKRSKRPRAVSQDDLRNHQNDQRHTNVDMLPYLLELNVRGKPKYHVLPLNVTEVVNVTEVANNRSEYNGKHFLQLSGSDIRPRHCVIAHTEGIVTMTPNSHDAETYVERQRIYETTMLKHGMTVQFGKDRLYRFLDPRFEAQPNKAQRGQPVETKFDVDGKVESTGVRPSSQVWENKQRRSASDKSPGSPQGPPGKEDLLPASVEYSPNAEDRLLISSILEVNSKQLQFKLAPTYTIYMAIRHLLASSPSGPHKAQIADFVSKTAKMTQQCIQDHHNDPPALGFWMANSSEILHMFKQDGDVQPLCLESQEMLAEAVQMAFHHLVHCLQGDLQRVMPAFLNPNDDEREEEMGQRYNMGHPSLADVLNTLSAAMTMLRRCRVNAALAIQLFSQLFHFINMWLFNFLVVEPQLQLCTRAWGLLLKRRLGSVEAWAEKQGLELAADCHLCRIIQAAHLLQAPKSTEDDISNISTTCFKLNSLQLRALLTRYIPEPNEPPVPGPFVERVVAIAENMADELTRTDGREVRLEEDPDLQLPFLLPEDGYTCDTIRGVPNGLPEFVRQLESVGLCRFSVNNNASGSWTVYMGDGPPPELQGGGGGKPSPGAGLPTMPEVITISFNKFKGSMGLSIVAATGEGQQEQGIYIKSVVEGAAAALDGRLQAGDQLLEVDGKSLVGVSQDKAAELMTKTGQVVRLKVAKQGAFYHNLATLLSQPSPTSQRAAHNRGGGRSPPGDGAPPPYEAVNQRPVNGYDKQMAPPGNMADLKAGPGQSDPFQRRDINAMSKSTSNLHVDTSFERNSLQGQMKPAQSVGVLHPSSPGYGQYSPGDRRQNTRANDYENQPQYPPADGPGDRESFDSSRHSQQNFNFMDPRQNLPKSNNQSYIQQGGPHRASDRSSVSSRTSSNSNRDHQRPQSAYYDPHNNMMGNQDAGSSRPRSEDVSKWQDSYDDPRSNYGRSNSGGNSPPYSNIGPQARDPQPQHQPPPQKPTAHERLFSQQGAPQRINVNSYNRQPNFYENTMPLQQELPPPFHQLQRPPTENEMRPRVSAKPAVVPKKNQPRVPIPDSSMMKIDNRQTQPHFYGQEHPPQVSSPHVVQQPGYQQQPPYDSRNMQQSRQQAPPPDLRNGPDFRTMPDPRNGPDLRTVPDPRNGPDLRTMPDPRNGPDLRFVQDPRNANADLRNMPDSRNGPDYRNVPDPRNQQDMRDMADPRNGPSHYSSQQMPRDQNQPPQSDNRYQAAQQLASGPEASYNYRDDLPPPPTMNNDMPPDLPPPPQIDDYQEELPPLPPPPSQDAIIDQKLAEEQQKLMEQINATNQFLAQRKTHNPNLPNQPQQQSAQSQSYQQQYQQQRQQPTSQPQYGTGEPPTSQAARVLPPGVDTRGGVPLGYQVSSDNYQGHNDLHPNYQNINFASEVRAASGPESQAPPLPQPPSEYESYDNPALKAQGFETRPGVAPKPKLKDRNPEASRSAWDRDAREKAEEEEQAELFKAREKEIAEMEARPYLSPQEQDRLRKLKMEHEFQRRVREIAEKGDYDLEDDDETAERIFTRQRLIQNLKNDLEKSKNRLRDLEASHDRTDAVREKERMIAMERRLEMYEKDKEEQQQRLQRVQDRRAKEHQEMLRQQRESRERQRQNYEEQKRQLMKEEEKMNQRREEELNKRRQFEKERRQELQEQREAEEMRIREEIRREDAEYQRQQLVLERQQRLDQQRPIRVAEEKMRLDSKSQPPPESSSYAQYANISNQGDNSSIPAPPPPERKSSYGYPRPNLVNNHQDFPPSLAANQSSNNLPSAMRNSTEPPPTGKKSVSFNTQMNTYKDRTPSHSISSYKSPTESQSSEQDFPPPNFPTGIDSEVFDSNNPLPPPPPPVNNDGGVSSPTGRDVVYNTSNNTPSVIGAQEIYRDPRSRIEAKIASQSTKGSGPTDRMSFREKMKYFAQEAGEDTIKVKPRTSKTLRDIESQLHGGQQYRGNVN